MTHACGPASESRSRPGGREDRPRRDGHPPARAGLVLEDVEDAVPGGVAPGQERRPCRPGVRRACTTARRRAGRARSSAREVRAARPPRAAGRGCPSRRRPMPDHEHRGWPRARAGYRRGSGRAAVTPGRGVTAAMRGLTPAAATTLRPMSVSPTRPPSRRAAVRRRRRALRARAATGRRFTSTTRPRCGAGRGPTARRWPAYPGAARAVYACKANATVASCASCSRRAWGWTSPRRASWPTRSPRARPGERLVVHGNNKSDADIRAAVAAGAGLLVVDHVEELDQVERIAAAAGRDAADPARVSRRASRPPRTPRSATGHASSKFGMPPADVARAAERAAALPAPAPRRPARAPRLADPRPRHLRRGGGRGWPRFPGDLAGLPVLDLGGGLAIAYTDDDEAPDLRAAAAATVAAVADRFDPLPELVLEPGRSVVGTVRRHALHGRGGEERPAG